MQYSDLFRSRSLAVPLLTLRPFLSRDAMGRSGKSASDGPKPENLTFFPQGN
ncbi:MULTISPECIES: hypothetical protein [unclassified Microcoleus]|uniref:hypothetical protein n=1 Tax=unclassified Microcoleus TaxID=2642155 RepID=UPI002FD4CEC0